MRNQPFLQAHEARLRIVPSWMRLHPRLP
jgi:hypothetical protein